MDRNQRPTNKPPAKVPRRIHRKSLKNIEQDNKGDNQLGRRPTTYEMENWREENAIP